MRTGLARRGLSIGLARLGLSIGLARLGLSIGLAPLAGLAAILAATPLLAVVVLGAPGFSRAVVAPDSVDPRLIATCLRSLLLGEASVAIGWPVGIAAALAMWGASAGTRRIALAAALLVLLMPPALLVRGLAILAAHAPFPDARLAGLIVTHAAQSAALVLLVVTGALNGLLPDVLRSAAAAGAGYWLAWRTVLLPPLAMTLAVAAWAAFAVSLGQSVLDAGLAPPHHPTLAGLVAVAARHGDAALAPDLLALAAMGLMPLGLLGLLSLLR